ncbi:MAG: T9SS type A sorting domain-containing protein [Bacteroidia bacterium]|nr:T9SS type A sorting domain-containing protein [Bacteroidia bacterium]
MNENEVYFFANTPGAGQHSYTFFGYQEWNSLFKYTYISGDGTGAGCQWENLSQNLPAGSPYRFDNIYVQGSYDMVIKFKPDEPNILFLGGTNLYRSADAFTTPDNIKQIGGYKPGSIDSNWDLYPNHHPDQHVLMFMPSNSDIMISANDGGVYKTYNCMADSVEWSKLNRGYLTSQLYTVIIDETTTNDIIIGGFQDNGNFFTNSADPAASWVMPLNGDGAFGNIANQGQTYYLSIQNGKTYKMQLDDEGHSLAFARIDPIGGDNYEFINPFVVDPNNNNIMYLPCYWTIFRNDSLNYIPLTGNKDSISTGWFRFSFEPQSYVTAISVSTILANRVYCASSGKVYRIDSADVNDPSIHPISPLPDLGYISCIAIDPRDADKVAAVISSYRTYSMFYSVNGGATWCHVAGNLEEEPDGDGNGPSFRWLEIMPFGNQTLYLLATSVGIFATDTLYLDVDSADWSIDSTMWVNVGQNIIGNVVTEMIVSRPTDNLVVVGTHGNGIFSIKLSDINALLGNKKYNRKTTDEISLYPNPAAGFIYLAFELINSSKVEIFIYDRTGKLIEMPETKTCFPGHNNIKLRTGDYPAGTYFIKVKTGNYVMIIY